MATTNKKSIKIFVFGGGTLGAIYSHLLSTSSFANVEVTIACRGNYPIVSTSGFKLTTNNWGNHTYHPHHVVSSPSEIEGKTYDYVFVTTKAIPDGSKLALSNFPLQKDVPIVLIQNGVGIEQPYRDAFPENPIISGVAYITASQPEPGHILQVGVVSNLILGLFDRPNPGDREKLQYLADLLDASKFPTKASDEIQVERWSKLGWNGSWNAICATTGLNTQEYVSSSPQALELVKSVIYEIARTANASGVEIDADGLVKKQVGWTLQAPPIDPSMLQDARKGEQMEVEVLCGNVWRVAEKAGVETPCVKSLYTVLTAMNWRFKNSAKPSKI